MSARILFPAMIVLLAAIHPAAAEWFAEEEPSELDGHLDVRLSVFADDAVYGDRGQRGHPVLFAACTSDVTSLEVDWGIEMGPDAADATLRLDDGDAVPQPFAAGADGRTQILAPGSAAIPVLRQMLGHDRLALSADGESGPVEASFDITGLDQAIAPLRRACGW